MAGFYGHLTTGVVLGSAYAFTGFWYGTFDWGTLALAGLTTAIGALTPDLDSDSGVPIRELFSLAGAVFPLFLIPRLRHAGVPLDQALCIMIGSYLFIRYGLSHILKRLSVHRGMFHSIPALCVAGLAVFDVYHHERIDVRVYLAGSMMVGFLSHLILDELFAVDLRGLPRFKKSFGTALKLSSDSWPATLFCYALLFALMGLAVRENRQEDYRAVITPAAPGQVKKVW